MMRKLTFKIELIYELAHFAYKTKELSEIFGKPESTIRGRLSELRQFDMVMKNSKDQWTLTKNRKLRI